MATQLAINPDTGEALALIGGKWQPTKIAANDAGERLFMGADGWEPMTALAAPPVPPPKPPPPTKAGLADIITNAMTFGLTNDVGGLARAVGPAARFVGNKVGIPGVEYRPGEVADAYTAGRDATIQGKQDYRDENPWKAFGGDVVGGMTSPATRLLMPAPGGTAAMNVARSAGTGAGAGALYGAGNTPGDLGDRAGGAVAGGLVGGAVGAVVPPLVDAAGKGVQYVADQTIGRMGAVNQQTVAARKLAEAIKREGLTPEQAAQRIIEMGKDATIADLGPNTQALAGAVSRAPGKGRAELTDFVTARQEGTRDAANVLSGSQSQRVMSGVDKLIPDKVDETLASVAARRARAGGNYEAAKADPINSLVDISPVIKSLDAEIASAKGGIKSGLERVRGLLVDQRGNPEVTIDALHNAKIAIDDLMSSGDARNSMGRVAQARIKDYQSQLLNAIETSGPAGAEYAAGRGATAAAWRTQDALEAGAAFMNKAEFGNASEIAKAVAKMTPEDAHAFRMGAAQAIKAKLADLNVRSDATKRVMDIPALEDKIRASFGSEETFKRYIDMLKGERQMFGTYAEITGNSKTAARQLADADLNQDPGGKAAAALDILRSPLNPMSYLRATGKLLGDAKARMATPEPVRDQIARMLMRPDPSTMPLLNQSLQSAQITDEMRRLASRGLLAAAVPISTRGLLGH